MTIKIVDSGIDFAFIMMSKTIYRRDNMDCSVKNANYERVLSVMERLLQDSNNSVCYCPRCLNDIAAIALNYLPPHYFVQIDMSKTVGSPWVMVETAVAEAIERVVENPKHERHMGKSAEYPDPPAHMS